jgi:hypothetical protein
VHFDTDREVMDAALKIIGSREPHEARVMHIKNTLTLEELEVSEACLSDPNPQTRFTPIGPARPLTFDADGNMRPV